MLLELSVVTYLRIEVLFLVMHQQVPRQRNTPTEGAFATAILYLQVPTLP